MFKYDNNTLPELISELFVPNTVIRTYNTRNKHNLRLKQSNRVYMYTNFSFIEVHIWNDIQKHINVSVSYSAFKQLTRTHYLYNNPKIFINISCILLVSIIIIKIPHNYVLYYLHYFLPCFNIYNFTNFFISYLFS